MQNRFLVLYRIPAHVMQEWLKTDEAERKTQETAIMQEWKLWLSEHAASIVSTEAAGKTRLVSAAGIAQTKNDIVICSVALAGSHEQAAALFINHPHLKIPEASIEIMEMRPMG